jgi:ABC-2 type transport system permease protein
VHAFVRLTRAEFRLFLREPVVVFFSLAFPTVLVGILGAIPDFRKPSPEVGGLRYVDVYVPIAMTLVLAMLALQFAPAVLANYREKGILRRMSATPVGPVALLGAQLVSTLATALASVALISLLGWFAYRVPAPRQFTGYALAFVLTAAALFAIGMFVAALAPSGKAGNAIGTFLFFPTMFFSGLWLPREVMPGWLQRIGDFTPLGAGEHALHDAATGAWPHAAQLLVLVAYAVAFGLAAARLFRWE